MGSPGTCGVFLMAPVPCQSQGLGFLLTVGLSPLLLHCSVEGEAPSSETGTSLDSPSTYHQGPLAPGSSLSPDHYEHTSVGAYGLYSGPPGQQRTRRPKLQHSTSILRKQAEEEAIKRSRSLSESYELSSDLQDKQVDGAALRPGRKSTWEGREAPSPRRWVPYTLTDGSTGQAHIHAADLCPWGGCGVKGQNGRTLLPLGLCVHLVHSSHGRGPGGCGCPDIKAGHPQGTQVRWPATDILRSQESPEP